MKKLILFVLLVGGICFAQAQKIKGDASCLKGQSKINIMVVYDGVTYDGDSEAKYLKEEDKAKDPEWKAAWTSTFRTEKWSPRLIKDLNKEISSKKMECGDFADAAYTVIVNIKDIDPGTFAGPMSVPCKISGNVAFVKTNEKTPFATIEFKGISHNGFFMTPVIEDRVAEAMSCVGEMIGKNISKIK
ncbi:MAG: hypothetical protein MJZ87_11385 [Bacteroidales bacterium]|nr:hypothetical protein [Bacteroidales bacterium]